jgi:hypothetical protein
MPATQLSKQSGQISRKRPVRKKIRYRQVCFKITSQQMEALKKLCSSQKTTPVRFLKSIVNKQVERYRSDTPVSYVTENQLELFGPDIL